MAPCMAKLVVVLLALCYARGVLGLVCYINWSNTLKAWGPEDTTLVAAIELPPSASGEWSVAPCGVQLFDAGRASRLGTVLGV